MSKSKVMLEGDGFEIEVSFDVFAEALGKQYILNEDVEHDGFAYLASLTLETRDREDYDIERTLTEFIRNSSDLDTEEVDAIEELLRA